MTLGYAILSLEILSCYATPPTFTGCPIEVRRHESEAISWESFRRAPEPRLRPLVAHYDGYTQAVPEAALHRQPPSGRLPFIVFGDQLEVAATNDCGSLRPYSAFVAGMHDGPALTRFSRKSAGIQIDLTPLAARAIFGIPMCELRSRVFEARDVLSPEWRILIERVRESPDWETSFAFIDDAIGRRLAQAPAPSEAMGYAWRRLERTKGRIGIGALAEEMGVSRKQLIADFHEHVGLSPKTAARVLRFQHALERMSAKPGLPLVEVAFECGYYDQAHFNRDFARFTGYTPTEYLRRIQPGSGGLLAG